MSVVDARAKETVEEFIEKHLIKDFDGQEGSVFQYIHKDIALEGIEKAREEEQEKAKKEYERGLVDGTENDITKFNHKIAVAVREEQKRIQLWLGKEFQKIEDEETDTPDNAYYQSGKLDGRREIMEKLAEELERVVGGKEK